MDTQTVPSPDTTEQLAVQAQDQIMQPVAEDAATERTITVDGQEYQTNLPDGVQLITDGGSARYLDLEQKPLLPGDFDALQPGTYFIRGEREKMDDFKPEPEMVPVERHIEVKESEFGKTISRESLGERWSIEPDAAELMQTLGYEVVQTEHGPRISGAPTPETVKAAAGLAGVDIRFFDDVEKLLSVDVTKATQSFPPHNIIKLDDTHYVVELAVAGFSKNEIEITRESAEATGPRLAMTPMPPNNIPKVKNQKRKLSI